MTSGLVFSAEAKPLISENEYQEALEWSPGTELTAIYNLSFKERIKAMAGNQHLIRRTIMFGLPQVIQGQTSRGRDICSCPGLGPKKLAGGALNIFP